MIYADSHSPCQGELPDTLIGVRGFCMMILAVACFLGFFLFFYRENASHALFCLFILTK